MSCEGWRGRNEETIESSLSWRVNHIGEIGGWEEIIINIRRERSWANMGLEAINLIGLESGVKVAYKYWDIFWFVLIENCMEVVPNLMFAM